MPEGLRRLARGDWRPRARTSRPERPEPRQGQRTERRPKTGQTRAAHGPGRESHDAHAVNVLRMLRRHYQRTLAGQIPSKRTSRACALLSRGNPESSAISWWTGVAINTDHGVGRKPHCIPGCVLDDRVGTSSATNHQSALADVHGSGTHPARIPRTSHRSRRSFAPVRTFQVSLVDALAALALPPPVGHWRRRS